VYLGRRVVALLYDLVAHRYNTIKQYTDEDDAHFLGVPLSLSLQGIPDPLVLDVATGTSRLPLALFRQSTFHGAVVALDNARRMLREATKYVSRERDRITWVWHHAVPLPFDDDIFDAVMCLEAFEFMPSTRDAVRECIRVLKPGGVLLVTNRIALGAKLMPGKTMSTNKFEMLLQTLGQIDITPQAWQYDYDLVWSLKPDDHKTLQASQNPKGHQVLRCPHCRCHLDRVDAALVCPACSRHYPIADDGVIELL
jgi:ubiquinone/menaquinone biosynthesis C-methylase UbiE